MTSRSSCLQDGAVKASVSSYFRRQWQIDLGVVCIAVEGDAILLNDRPQREHMRGEWNQAWILWGRFMK